MKIYLGNYKLIIFIVFFSAICRSLIFVETIYFTIVPIYVFIIINNRQYFFIKSNLQLFLFFIICFTIWSSITALWSPYPLVSMSRSTWFLFIALGSTLLGFLTTNNVKEVIKSLCYLNIIIVTITIFSLTTGIPNDSWTGGNQLGFKGFFYHQNSLGACIAFTLPFCIFYISKRYTEKKLSNSVINTLNLKMISRWIPFIILALIVFVNCILIILSRSRGSLITLLIFLLIFTILIFRFRNFVFFTLIIVSIFVILFAFDDNFKSFSKEIIYKGGNSFGDSRYELISRSLIAAKSGSVFGLGYGISERGNSILLNWKEENNQIRFVREKMVSILALIEEVGIIGLLLFIFPISYCLFFIGKYILTKNIWLRRFHKNNTTNFIILTDENYLIRSFILSYLIAISFHAQIESWWTGVSSTQLPFFYFMIGFSANQFNRE